MPDYETLRLGARVKAEFQFRGETKRVEVDGFFDVVVPSVASADTTMVAVLMHDRKKVEYRLIDGRLFRPLLQADFQTWKLGDVRNSKPPVVNGTSFRTLGYYRESPLLGSPWLDWIPRDEDVSEAMRARVKRAAPQAWDEVDKSLKSAAARGLRIVDGMLFQETRTPGWGIRSDNSGRITIKPMMPDVNEELPDFLLDPRTAASDLRAIRRRFNAEMHTGLRIMEPSLLPNTVESDAIAAFAIWAYDRISGNPVGCYDVNRLTDVMNFVEAAEKMALEGLPPGECLERIEHIVRRDRDGAGVHHDDGRTTVQVAWLAGIVMDIRRHISAPASPPPPDADDAEDIARAFGL